MLFFLIVLIVIVALAGIWFAASIKEIEPNEVAMIKYFGKIKKEVHESGLVLVLWCPGVELVIIPRDEMLFRFAIELDHGVWSSDHQSLCVDLSGSIRFPYNDADSLVLMIESGVPLVEEELQDWIEDEVVSGFREIMAAFNHRQALDRGNLGKIREAAMEFFHQETGLFVKSGICGKDPGDLTAGSGEVIIRVEKVDTTEELRTAMQFPVLATYQADAAKQTARMNAEQVGGQVLGIVARQHGMTINGLEADLKSNPQKAGLPVAEGGYKESFAYAQDQTKRDRAGAVGELTDIRIGNSDGSSMNGELPAFAAAALLLRGGGRSGGKKDNRGGGRDNRDRNYGVKGRKNMTDAEKEAEYERIMHGDGK